MMPAYWLQQPGPLLDAGSELAGYFKVLLLLAGILCFCYVTARVVLPRLLGMRARRPGGSVEMVERFSLEPRRTLYVIRAGAQFLIVASSEHGVQFLTELDAEGVRISRSNEPQDTKAL